MRNGGRNRSFLTARQKCNFRQFLIFKSRNKDFMTRFFEVYIRSHLENSTTVWNPHLLKDINLLESVQRKFTKRIPGLRNVPYEDRLGELGLETLESRRLRMDMSMCYKIIHGLANVQIDDFLTFRDDERTLRRNHNQTLALPKARLDCRKFSFAGRVVQPWNSLSQIAIDSPSLRVFKNRLASSDFSRFLKYSF